MLECWIIQIRQTNIATGNPLTSSMLEYENFVCGITSPCPPQVLFSTEFLMGLTTLSASCDPCKSHQKSFSQGSRGWTWTMWTWSRPKKHEELLFSEIDSCDAQFLNTVIKCPVEIAHTCKIASSKSTLKDDFPVQYCSIHLQVLFALLGLLILFLDT